MCAFFRKTTALERRRRELERELALLENDIKTLSKVVKDPDNAEKVRLKHREANEHSRKKQASSTGSQSSRAKSYSKEHEERFAEYLSGNFQTIGSLKNERRLQRNKAVVMIIVVVIVLLWMWRHFF